MKLTIVYDNEVFKGGLKEGWGFSAYIEVGGRNILFDTGWDGNDLLYNMRALKINPKKIDTIVLSHQHWDHVGGLNHVLNECEETTVVVPTSFSEKLKKQIKNKSELVEIKDPKEIIAGVHTTGELEVMGEYKGVNEQSLAVETKKGLVVVVGCSHPGLEKILVKASEFGRLYGVVGGFHGFDKYDVLEDLEFIVPTHCTQHKKEIRDLYGDKVGDGGVGWGKTVE